MSVKTNERLRIAIQKSGRLYDDSIELLKRCGLRFDLRRDRLLAPCRNQPVDLLRVRDDDIPGLLVDQVIDLGIVGANVLQEDALDRGLANGHRPVALTELGFGGCRLSLAVPNESDYRGVEWFRDKRIATSYPALVAEFLRVRGIEFHPCNLTGSVEIAPRAGLADAICDLVSTGATLEANGLCEVELVLTSTALLVESSNRKEANKRQLIDRLLTRVRGIESARESKYVMLHAPRSRLDKLIDLLPGAENPTVVPLANATKHGEEQVALHALSTESVVWETLEELKALGASSILIVPVEKVME